MMKELQGLAKLMEKLNNYLICLGLVNWLTVGIGAMLGYKKGGILGFIFIDILHKKGLLITLYTWIGFAAIDYYRKNKDKLKAFKG
jgi:hypothetical protein